jgi:hypothetical protein
MKVLISDRSVIYQILFYYFDNLKKHPRIAELGVLNGSNAEVMHKILKPEKMYLIDSWAPQFAENDLSITYPKTWATSHVDPNVIQYYGGPLDDPQTYERLYLKTLSRFENEPNVEIIRKNTSDAFKLLDQFGEQGKMDLLYLDANHEYETVFWELMTYKSLLSEIGCFQLNDCSHSQKGLEQNLGVLEAVVKFCKVSGFQPVLMTNTDWSDILIMQNNSSSRKIIDGIVENSNISFVEVPDQLLGAARIVGDSIKNVSFS